MTTEHPTNFTPLVNLMKRASAKLERPTIRLQDPTDEHDTAKLHLIWAGKKSKIPGSINLTDGSGYGNNIWYGRILPNGDYQKSRFVDKAIEKWVLRILCTFQADPAGTATVYGKRTSNCCFCGRDLTAEESVTTGYGPICAENYGLPWGEIDKAVTEIVEDIEFTPEDDKLLEQLQAPPTIDDLNKQVTELRYMFQELQKEIRLLRTHSEETR